MPQFSKRGAVQYLLGGLAAAGACLSTLFNSWCGGDTFNLKSFPVTVELAGSQEADVVVKPYKD